jgi:hypothetical protein
MPNKHPPLSSSLTIATTILPLRYPAAMPLFTKHHTMHINTRHALCLELLCTLFLPAPCQCQHSSNQGKYYVTVSSNMFFFVSPFLPLALC